MKKTPIGQDSSEKRLVSDARLPTPLRQVKENSLNILCMQLNEMFTSCDDLFFDLSGRASSNTEQNLYFESMREIRLKKSGLMAGFQREYERSFHELASQVVKPVTAPAFNSSTLSLVENDQLEQKVAISGMITKCRANLQEELYHLSCRFDFLIPGKQIDEHNNPLDPQQICGAFAKAAEILELNIKARIILYKQFDRFVIARLGKVYNQANEWLINAGVLPKIRSSIRKAADEGIYGGAAQAAGATAGTDAAQPFVGLNELRSLLSELRSVGINVPSVVAIIPGYNPAAPTISRNELMGGLAQAQIHPQQLDASATDSIDIRTAIRQILINAGHQGQPKSVPPVEEDIINLVAMFFDFVLDDPNVPVPIQALLSRLQIPVLKIALHDRRFFNDNKHPARMLINEIAGASIGWSTLQQHAQDQLYEKIASCVQNIHDNFVNDIAIFAEQHEQLKAYLEQENRKTSLVEKRASEAAVGQATTNHVRQLVRSLLEERCSGRSIPLEVHRFLFDQWHNVLFLLYLKEGERSASWLDGCQIVDDLIWIVTPHEDEKSRQRLAQMVEPLFARIGQKLQLTAVSVTELEFALTTLRQVYERIRDGSHNELQFIKTDIGANAVGASPPQVASAPEEQAVPTKAWESMTAIERQQVQNQRLQFEFIQKAEKLPIGTWIEFSHLDGEPGPLRFKLTAKIDLTDSFVFVNRFGTRVVEKSRKAFAADLQQNLATVLERGSAFDRAIARIATNLRDIKAA